MPIADSQTAAQMGRKGAAERYKRLTAAERSAIAKLGGEAARGKNKPGRPKKEASNATP